MTETSIIQGDQVAGHKFVYGDVVYGNKIVLTPDVLERLLPKPYQPPSFPPLEQGLPEHGTLPPGSYLPFTRNRIFTGRQSDLLIVAQALIYEGRGQPAVGIVQPAGLTGMGGIGKTQLAIEFAHRYGQFFYGVHWINASSPENIAAGIVDAGAKMGLIHWPDKFPEQLGLTLQVWRSQPPRLVILDNLEDPQILQDWLPALEPACVLLTSRNPRWPPDLGLALHRLDVLPRPDSIALLRKLISEREGIPDSDLDRLAERLGDLPLALDLAGRYLGEMDISVQAYLDEIEQMSGALEHTSLANWKKYNPTRHDTSLAAAFLISWNNLDPADTTDSLARSLFQSCGYCAPNSLIPSDLLTACLPEQAEKKTSLVLRRLVSLGLLNRAEKSVVIHPLLAEFGRMEMEDEGGEGGCSPLADLAEALGRLAYAANKTGLPANAAPYRPHLPVVAAWLQPINPAATAALLNELGYHLDKAGELLAARPYYEHALAIRRETLGNRHPDTASGLNNLGLLLKDLGDLPGARAHLEEALAIRREVLGNNHPDTASNLNNLGLLLKDLGDLAGARAYYEQALAITQEVLGDRHLTTAIRLNNLGLLLKDLGDLPGARAHLERALAITREVLGDRHPDTAIRLNNLGLLLKALGDLPGAQAHYEQALAIDRETLGERHPTTAIRFNNLGNLLKDLGDLPGARAHYEQALAIFKEILGEKHPSVATLHNNLGLLMQAQSNLLGARAHYEQALAIFKELLGEKHLSIATLHNNLGLLLQAQGDLPGARVYYEQALAIKREFLGEKHPSIATGLNNLGMLLQAQGDLPAARTYLERALAIFTAALGPEHPNTRIVRDNLDALDG